VQKLSKNEVLLVNIGSLSTGGRVLATKADMAKIQLTNPVCTEVGEKIALSRRVDKHWRYKSVLFVLVVSVCGVNLKILNFRLIGWGEIRRGETIDPIT
jgi:hypothetical protein